MSLEGKVKLDIGDLVLFKGKMPYGSISGYVIDCAPKYVRLANVPIGISMSSFVGRINFRVGGTIVRLAEILSGVSSVVPKLYGVPLSDCESYEILKKNRPEEREPISLAKEGWSRKTDEAARPPRDNDWYNILG